MRKFTPAKSALLKDKGQDLGTFLTYRFGRCLTVSTGDQHPKPYRGPRRLRLVFAKSWTA